MNEPDVLSTIRDDRRNITYHILAYRPLTHEEKVITVRTFVTQHKGARPPNGSTVTIRSLIGAHE